MGDYVVAGIPQNLIEVLWDDLAPHLQRVVDVAHNEITLDSIKAKALRGDSLIVPICKGKEIVAVNTVEVRTFDSGEKALFIPVTGGDELDGWMEQFLEVAKGIAKDYQCTKLRGVAARKGWLRVLKNQGWKEVNISIECEV